MLKVVDYVHGSIKSVTPSQPSTVRDGLLLGLFEQPHPTALEEEPKSEYHEYVLPDPLVEEVE